MTTTTKKKLSFINEQKKGGTYDLRIIDDDPLNSGK